MGFDSRWTHMFNIRYDLALVTTVSTTSLAELKPLKSVCSLVPVTPPVAAHLRPSLCLVVAFSVLIVTVGHVIPLRPTGPEGEVPVSSISLEACPSTNASSPPLKVTLIFLFAGGGTGVGSVFSFLASFISVTKMKICYRFCNYFININSIYNRFIYIFK